MARTISIHLEWSYTPVKLLGYYQNYEDGDIYFIFSEGKVKAIIDPLKTPFNQELSETLNRKITSLLDSVCMLNHQEYYLTKPTQTDIKEDGSKTHHLSVSNGIHIHTLVGSPHITVKNEDGTIIADSLSEKIQKEKEFADKLYKYRDDPTLSKMIQSYKEATKEATKEAGKELVCLYEIRDAIATIFNNKENAKKNLNLTKLEWDTLGIIANNTPIDGSRHKGKMKEPLPKASKTELQKARKNALLLIERYLDNLDRP